MVDAEGIVNGRGRREKQKAESRKQKAESRKQKWEPLLWMPDS